MPILPALATQFQSLFPATDHGEERWRWFMLTLQAILVPITASRTSNLLRAIAALFGVEIAQSRYYTFMASVKLHWERVWEVLWRAIPNPLTEGRLLLALDDSVNPKTGRKVFGCQTTFDHAAKTNQSQYPWAQTIVTVGLLKTIHGRWCCLPLAFALSAAPNPEREMRARARSGRRLSNQIRAGGPADRAPGGRATCGPGPGGRRQLVRQPWVVPAAAGGAGAARASALASAGQFRALRHPRRDPGRAGRPRTYGTRLGNATQLAATQRVGARTYTLNLYGGRREVVAVDRLVMLKTLHCRVRVVWVFRKTNGSRSSRPIDPDGGTDRRILWGALEN